MFKYLIGFHSIPGIVRNLVKNCINIKELHLSHNFDIEALSASDYSTDEGDILNALSDISFHNLKILTFDFHLFDGRYLLQVRY